MNVLIKNIIKQLLAQRGLAVTKIGQTMNSSKSGYISATETIAAANKNNQSICEYVEDLWDQNGFELIDKFQNKHGHGFSQYFILKNTR